MTKRGFPTDADYRHYDPNDGRGSGSYWEWVAAAERLASGGERRFRSSRASSHGDPDLAILGLTSAPRTIAELLAAFRTRAKQTHPDHGGSTEEFKAVYAAYERLTRRYA